METFIMMQGDSYPVPVTLYFEQTDEPLTPDMVSDVEINVGDSLRKTYANGEAWYDTELRQWYFVPTQEETFALEPGKHKVQARIKFANGQYSPVKGIDVGTIVIRDAQSEEVI